MKLAVVLVLVVALASSSTFFLCHAHKGVDVSQATYENNWKCLKSHDYKFAIIRCYESVGRVDSNCPHTVYNAWDGGMDAVSLYFFPDPRADNPAHQINSMVEYLAKFNIKPGDKKPHTYGMLWLDIEGPQYWTSSKEKNREFFKGLVERAKHHGIKVGVYTSESQWSPIMGDWHGGSDLPLWYAHYDGKASFSDFRPFGGWHKPSMKQYAGNINVCGAGVDENWHP
ncbi:glycoside hydrolase family 25 protein [Salpingoeca rosetta]|uniref:Glycoside hydrolase family 25 protein n=1 Tax=Salpingoeca rosetta (strain ATCC 50818 / BSB-021) TaxID=946362 RepID=F2URK2_SALR5|nr:glycoside hydrolase family 25 protein [Salpingoeca rosetta]EGD80171.1 glycoside hydrolase family 25 protein [Salpingoeca rosetta]|eukprot:XP_004988233.1 glycoside hydrolase family 25 protein [Salpingoeca rosetta]